MGISRFKCLKFLAFLLLHLPQSFSPFPSLLNKIMGLLSLCLFVRDIHTWFTWSLEEGTGSMKLELPEAASQYKGTWN